MFGSKPAERLYRVFLSLPLFDDLYLAMQAQNIAIVHDYLTDLESDLLRTNIDTERTPIPQMMFVSALSQMWVFAVYELLRTWRQRAKEVIAFGESLRKIALGTRKTRIAAKVAQTKGALIDGPGVIARQNAFKQAGQKQYVIRLSKALQRTEPVFRDIEAVRVTLAKHEVPKSKGIPALNPGYARIDPFSGSMSWQIELRDSSVTVVKRSGIAEDLLQMRRAKR